MYVNLEQIATEAFIAIYC